MRKVQDSNAVSWREGQSEALKAYLASQKVDANNRVAVHNHFEQRRQDAARVILHAIKSVELEMSKKTGKPVRLEDLDPYSGEQVQAEPEPEQAYEAQ